MMKRNDDIQKLFDDYAEELTPREDLGSKARDAMAAKKQSPLPRSKTHWTVHLAWAVPVFCVLLVSLIAFGTVFANIFNDPTSNDQHVDSSVDAPQVQNYTFADVKGKRVQLADCDSVLNVSALADSEFEVVGERYYAFYAQNGQLRYIKALLGVRGEDGTFTELHIIAEADGYVREDLADEYDRSGALVSDSGYALGGEYVTQAFFGARGFHFYVEGLNGEPTDQVEKILQKLL